MNQPPAALTTFFSYGFRPLFLLATLHAVLSVSFWSAWWLGLIPVDWQRLPASWHGHDMLMGLAAAAIGGFLLTAVANWTGRKPVSGLPLGLLCLAWLGGRLSIHYPLLSLFADQVYWIGLWALLANEILRAGNRRNYKVLVVLLLLVLSDTAFHLTELFLPSRQQQALWVMLWLMILLINVIGGRVIPAFTSNWLRRRAAPRQLAADELPAAHGPVDVAAIATLLLFALAVIGALPPLFSIPLGAVCCLLQTWRLARWKFYLTGSDPLVWMMHLSYLWIPLGIGLWTLALTDMIPVSAAVHALTIGAIASMILSIASRAALGHTGRPLVSHPLLTAAILLLSVAAVSRITAALTGMQNLMAFSALAWVAAFLCFAVRYIPILTGPASEQP
ncbi:MAG: NnrS family protein [Pseudomonadales bacterium]|nr:NnrS family protein [Pseudomonadales bacterium]